MSKTIIVGPSRSLSDNKLGKTIDSYDVVCRMNAGGRPDLLNGKYKEIIGTKTDIWFLGHIGLAYAHNKYNEIIITNEEYYNQHKATIKNLVLCDSKVVDLAKLKTDRVPTTGLLSIFYMLNRYNDVTICGFDGFKNGHFYGNKYISTQDTSDEMAAKGFGRHNALQEIKYIENLIKGNTIKKL